MRTVEDLFNQAKIQLFFLPHPELDAKILLCKSASISIEQFHINPGKKITKKQADLFFNLIKKRQQGFPLAYLTRKKEFWSLEFRVDSRVLIPRPETELIVEKVVELSPTGILVDIGTGCGNIAICLAKTYPELRVVATDVSKKTLEMALLNAKTYHLDRIEFYQGDMMDPLKKIKLENGCDFIVSNPPYVSEKEWRELSPEITEHEPKKAVVSGQTGLESIEELIYQAPAYLKSGGFLIFEFGAGQEEKILNIFGSDWIELCCANDLYGIPRVCVARKK